MQAEKITRDNIRTFVMKFYAKLIKDETVGPFFIAKLAFLLLEPRQYLLILRINLLVVPVQLPLKRKLVEPCSSDLSGVANAGQI